MKAVPDPRCGRKTKHDHGEVLVCLVAGFLSGKTTIRRSLRWCQKHLEELREYLPLKNGIASPSTVCRLLSGIDEELFALEFMEWTGEIVSTKGIHLAVDGKAMRAAMEKVKDFRAPMVLNAVDAETGVVVAQMPSRGRKAYDTADGRADEGGCNPCTDRPDGIGGSRREFPDTASDGAGGFEEGRLS